ncbi:MAG: glycoside hydrolase family 3 protein, partial [Marinilabiliales bacterium]|nr:glycoside hydrolase family 3 protein [Marinilabiliales bacterium]
MNPTNLFNKKIGGVVLTLSLILSFALSKAATPASADDAKVAAIVAKMTLEQKARLVVGTGMHFIVPDSIKAKLPPGFGGPFDPTDPAYSAITEKIQQYLPGAAGVTIEYPALGIASQVLTDGPAGVRIQPVRPGATQTYYCTAFPIATLLASSWDQELVRNVGVAMGNEVKEYGSDVILGPALNIQRDPLCGRNFEYYSEDPLVAGKMAAAMVKGIQSNGVGTSIKHFAANNSETNRMSVNTIVSQRALREIYLRGFEIVVKEAQPWTVMSSYNKLNGVYTSESPDLLTKVLREDWGFKGYVMTDWGGGSDAVAQMIAGNDLLMPGQPGQTKAIMAAVKSGKMSEKLLNRNVSKILKVMLMAPRYNQYKFSNTPDLKSHAMVTREAASNGMVLLKNNTGSLPLSTSIHNIAAFGNTSYEFISGGTGSGDVNEAYTVSLTEGLKNGGYQVQSALQDRYLKYIADTRASNPPSKNPFAAMMGSKEPVAEMKVPVALAEEMAAANDVALITIGRNAGEGYDRTATEGDFYLTPTEKEMIKHVCDAFHAKGKKAIVIINSGGVIETASWRDLPDAILLAWQGGQEGGNSVTDILSGKVNPSGKLAVTFPISYQDCPSAKNFPGVEIKSDKQDNSADLSGFSFMRKTPWQITYEEDIFVGYRYFTTFQKPVA